MACSHSWYVAESFKRPKYREESVNVGVVYPRYEKKTVRAGTETITIYKCRKWGARK